MNFIASIVILFIVLVVTNFALFSWQKSSQDGQQFYSVKVGLSTSTIVMLIVILVLYFWRRGPKPTLGLKRVKRTPLPTNLASDFASFMDAEFS